MNRRKLFHTPILVLTLALLFPLRTMADIYTWVDENGVTHYSTSRPAGQPSTSFPTDPAFRQPAAIARPSSRSPGTVESAEAQALRQRLEMLEGLLESERSSRVTDLKDQLENERDRVRRLETERSQWSDIGGLWSPPALAPTGVWWNPAPVILLPGHGRALKSGKSQKQRVHADGGRLPYPSISGPSSNLR